MNNVKRIFCSEPTSSTRLKKANIANCASVKHHILCSIKVGDAYFKTFRNRNLPRFHKNQSIPLRMCGMDDIWQSIQQKSEDQSSAETAHVVGIVDAPTREAEVEGEGDHQNQALHGEALVMPFMDKEDYGKKTHNAKDGPAGPAATASFPE